VITHAYRDPLLQHTAAVVTDFVHAIAVIQQRHLLFRTLPANHLQL